MNPEQRELRIGGRREGKSLALRKWQIEAMNRALKQLDGVVDEASMKVIVDEFEDEIGVKPRIQTQHVGNRHERRAEAAKQRKHRK